MKKALEVLSTGTTNVLVSLFTQGWTVLFHEDIFQDKNLY